MEQRLAWAQLEPGIHSEAGGLCPGGWIHVYIGFPKSVLGGKQRCPSEPEVDGRAEV